MDAVRVTVAEMQSEETRLLDLRVEKTREARRTTRIIAVGGTLVGVVFLMLAGFSIRREEGLDFLFCKRSARGALP